MGLQFVNHLEAMLDVSEKPIRVRQLPTGVRVDQLLATKRVERLHGVALSNGRQLPAEEGLDRLYDKLDFANAADAELDVSLQFALGLHLFVDGCFDRPDLLEVAEGKRLTEDERRHPPEKLLTQPPISRDRPGLQ